MTTSRRLITLGNDSWRPRLMALATWRWRPGRHNDAPSRGAQINHDIFAGNVHVP